MTLGALPALLCAVHCAAMPLLVAFLPGLRVGPGIEWGLLAAAVLLGIAAARSGVAMHRNRWVLLPIVSGLAIWGTALVAGTFAGAEALHATGSMLTAGGMLWNARLRHTACACRRHSCGSSGRD